MDSAKLIGIFA